MDSRDSSMEAKVLAPLDRTSRVTDSRRIEESRPMDSRTIDSRAMDSRSRWTDMARRWCSKKLCISSSELKQKINKNICLKIFVAKIVNREVLMLNKNFSKEQKLSKIKRCL